MKALGVGLGAFAFGEVEVVRLGLDPPALVLRRSAAGPGRRCRGGPVAPLAHPHRPGGHGPGGRRGWPRHPPPARGGPAGRLPRRSRSVEPMQPVLTVAEMNAVDRAALASTPLDVLVGRAGTGGGRGRLSTCWAAPTAAGWWWSPAGATTAPTGGSPPSSSPVRGARVPDRRGGHRAGNRARRPGHRRRLRHRVPRRVPATGGATGDPGAGRRHPLGGGRATPARPAGPRWPPRARSPSWPSSPASSRATAPGWPARSAVADIGLPPGEPGRLGGGGRRRRPACSPPGEPGGNKWSAAVLVVAGIAGHDRGRRPLRPRRLPVGGGDGPPGRARRGPVRGAGHRRRSAWTCPPTAGRPTPWRLPSAARWWWSGPGLGREPATAAEVRRLVAESPVPVVVDADGLFALGRPGCRRPHRGTVDGGAHPPRRRVRPADGADPGPDRIAAARALAAASGAVALLKGPTTAVADPGGRVLLGVPALRRWPPPAPVTSCPGSSAR